MALGRACLLPPLSSGGALVARPWLRFHTPFIEPDVVREWKGKLERVTVLEKGFAWNGKSYASLSQIAKAMTGTTWNGHRFFGLRTATSARAAQARRGLVSEATARPDVASDGPTASKQVGRRRSLPNAVTSAAGSAAPLDRGRRRNDAAAAS